MTKIIRHTFAGALGAFIAWAVMEPTPLMPDTETPVAYGVIFVIGLIFGLLVGFLLGLSEAMGGLSHRNGGKVVVVSALVGAAGGILGLTFGNSLYSAFTSVSKASPGFLSFILLLVGRAVGWALIGGFVGLSQGLATNSAKKIRNGFIGGFLGGGLGGTVFEILVMLNKGHVANLLPGMIRFVSFVITGGSIGLFIGLVSELAKKAWLLKMVGRNEGKEYELFKPITVIGRSELADIPAFGDPDVTEKHSVVIQQGGRYYIEDAGSLFGTSLNGTRIADRQPLRSGDVITVGKTRFQFRDKSAPRMAPAVQSATVSGAVIPTAQGVCPFCGAARDSNGNCECSAGVSDATQISTQGVANTSVTQLPTQLMGGQATRTGARLVGVSGVYANQVFPLEPSGTGIGRDSSNTISLASDRMVSRMHARIVEEGGAIVAYDEGSSNGTFVNGEQITRRALMSADIIQIGSTKFRVEL